MDAHATLFADIDSLEPDRFARHLAEGVTMRFGNADPVTGRDAVRDVWAGFCDGVAGVRHDVVEQWTQGEATVVQADVTYTRTDATTVTVPVVTIYRGKGALIDRYDVFIDLAPLFG